MSKELDAYLRQMENSYGSSVTNNPAESGYLMPDGRWLRMGVDGSRDEDHRGVYGITPVPDREGGRWLGVVEWMKRTGCVRWMPETCSFDVHVKPTKQQIESMVDVLKNFCEDGVDVEVTSSSGSDVAYFNRKQAGKLKAFISDFSKSPGMQKNPRYSIRWTMADGETSFRDFINEPQAKRVLHRDIELNNSSGTLVWWGLGKKVLLVRPSSQVILTMTESDSPTNVHILKQIAEHMPEWRGYRIGEYGYLRGDNQIVWTDTGMDLGEFVANLKHLSATFVHKPSRREVERKKHDFEALTDPREITWYHATLAKNLPSIRKRGLLPASTVDVEGWSPSWNIEKQDAVYLTSSLLYAANIAETLAKSAGEDAVVLSVDGKGLELGSLIADEDALRDDYDGSVQYGDIDTDFPDFVTSWYSNVQSIASVAPVKAKYIGVAVTGRYSEESYDMRYEEEIEQVVEFSGPMAEELAKLADSE